MTCRVEGPLPLSSVALCREALTKHQRSGCRTSISPPSAGYGAALCRVTMRKLDD
jgi:hypothetical protein